MAQVLVLFRFLVVASTILGGLHGIIVTIPLFFRNDERGFIAYLLIACMLTAYAYVAAAGLIFWRSPNRTRPLFWAQIIQVPWISLPGLVYKFAVGATASLAFAFSNTGDKLTAGLETNFRLGSSWKLNLFRNATVGLGVNLIPVAVLLLVRYLDRLTRKLQTLAAGNPSADRG
jgi:hypothetical protein